MKSNNLTIKQEKFCQAYIKLGDKSAAYREAYSAERMKANTIHRKAQELFNNGLVTARIEVLQDELKKRNDITIDEIVNGLADMLQFDVAELYDEDGKLKNIHQIPKKARLMISELHTDEIFSKNKVIGQSKKVKIFDKLNVVEKLMKHLGGYEKDNRQKETIVKVSVSKEEIKQISDELENEV
ncbi:terminase small subunit [Flavobacterium sp. UMI-01]|uniref:terminase small subunit n=1 Tax=Flavobacterium sp. UMI-01 TaxID=1441053 RepID=UPI001C7DFC03|nr:terminase small subunit [Flavobacterium sp. UMI-01]GIZ08360.1 hypothetical protein FUMI01_10870 [Flavobacterium sp. UMI-01]